MVARKTLVSLAGLLIFGLPVASDAQPAWDASAFVGVFAGSAPTAGDERYSDNWFHTGQAGVSVGRHITRHLKVELEAAGTGSGRRYVQQLVTVPGGPSLYPVSSEVTTAVTVALRRRDLAVFRQRVGPSLRDRRRGRGLRTPRRPHVGAALLPSRPADVESCDRHT